MNINKRTHTYKQAVRYSLELDVYLPEATGKSMPAIVYIHGGALIMGNRNIVNENEIEAVTGEGMAYISLDYRLAPETRLEEIAEDIQDAIAWTRNEGVRLYGFDASRIAVSGKSAGGYLALLCGTVQNRPNAIISFYGYGDILGDWYSHPSPHYLKHPLVTQEESDQCMTLGVPTGSDFQKRWPLYLRSRQTGSWATFVSGYNPLEITDKLLPYCPIHMIDAQFPPTLLLHGSEDTDVPVEQSEIMYAALKDKGIKAQLLIIPQAEHGFDFAWTNTPEKLGQVIRFLKETL